MYFQYCTQYYVTYILIKMACCQRLSCVHTHHAGRHTLGPKMNQAQNASRAHGHTLRPKKTAIWEGGVSRRAFTSRWPAEEYDQVLLQNFSDTVLFGVASLSYHVIYD